MIARYASAISTGTIVTLGLFFLMQSLIAMQPSAVVDARDRHDLVWVRVPPVEDPPVTRENLPNKDFVKPTELPKIPRATDGDEVVLAIPPHNLPPPPGPGTGLIDFMSDGPLVCLVRVEPTYPAIAAARGIDGYVIVEFDVLANGSVANVIVVQSSNRVFDKAAAAAAARFRYKPRVVDGVAVASTRIQKLFRFEMKD